MSEDNGTTIWVDPETKIDLQRLAEINGRSLVGQIRWMVKRDLAELEIIPEPGLEEQVE